MVAAQDLHQEFANFSFNKENEAKVKKIVAKYPSGRQQSAVIPLLDIAQRQAGNWLPIPVMQYIADYLDMPYIKVYEVATFYTMFNMKPVGKHFIQVCRTTPCWLRGSDQITQTVKDKCGIRKGETSNDGNFTLIEVECLGACANAPMVQINDHYYEDLTPEQMEAMIEDMKAGKELKQGSQTGRVVSEPVGKLTTLTDQQKKKGEK